MSAAQADLFAPSTPAAAGPGEEVLARVRARLHASLAVVKSAEEMPWKNLLKIINEDNAFRYGTSLLPAEEGAALWAEFDVEMDRLYAVMNAGIGTGQDA